MSWLAWKKIQRIARIPARSEPGPEPRCLQTEEGLPLQQEECMHIEFTTEQDDA